MSMFLLIVGVAGWYFLLNMIQALHVVAFNVLGCSITWFGVLFAAGTALIAKLCLSK